MLQAIEENLLRGVKLLNSITEEQYANTSTAPYYSSIGRHIRHILDVFDCVFTGFPNGYVDLSARARNEDVELKIENGLDYFNTIINQVKLINPSDFDVLVLVSDDLGQGKIEQNYTLGGLLVQAHSHAIHHFASLGYIICQLGIEIPDEDFGFNPTTPKLLINNY